MVRTASSIKRDKRVVFHKGIGLISDGIVRNELENGKFCPNYSKMLDLKSALLRKCL